MLNGLLDQIGQPERSRRLETIHGWGFPTAHTLQEMLEFGIQRLNRGGAHLFDESIVSVQQLAVIG